MTPTNNPAQHQPNHKDATHADPRAGLAAAIELGRTVISQVQPGHLGAATPCREFDVSQLAAHSLGVLDRIRMVGERNTNFPDLVPDYPQPAYVEDWKRLAGGIERVWADDSLLGAMLTLPFAEMPGAAAVGLYTSEVLIHAWDLATAIGVEVEWDQVLAAQTLTGMQMALPPEGRDDPGIPFDDVVPTAEDATAMDQLVAWVGRNPS